MPVMPSCLNNQLIINKELTNYVFYSITNMEQSLNEAANNAVATAIADKVLERTRLRVHHFISEAEEKKIKDDVTTMALKMIQGSKR